MMSPVGTRAIGYVRVSTGEQGESGLMVDADGFLCFPDVHQLGLDVLVRVARNTAGVQ